MRKHGTVLLAIALCAALAGCAPQESLFPIYKDDELYFDENLNGTWRAVDSPDKSGEDDLHLTFKGDKDTRSYLVIGRSQERKDFRLFMEARLVHIGKYQFMDFATPGDANLETLQPRDGVFPGVVAHIFARVSKEPAGLKLSFLEAKWIEDESKAKRLQLPHVDAPDGIILSAPTSDLRQFALGHAEDEKAFSFVEHLVREK